MSKNIEEFLGNLELLRKKVNCQLDKYLTEAQVRKSIIDPMLEILGYDDTNPDEVDVEFGASLFGNIKSEEKVDYAIKQDGKVVMLIEAKHFSNDLHKPKKELDQLHRYYSKISECKFGILTNGLLWKFYGEDSSKPNIIDTEPFFVFDLCNSSNEDCKCLFELFSKNCLQMDILTKEAQRIKMSTLLKLKLYQEIREPNEIISLFKNEYEACGIKVIRNNSEREIMIANIIKNVFKEIFDEKIQEDRRKINEIREREKQREESENNLIRLMPEFTKEEEMAWRILQSISAELIDNIDRIKYKDYQGHCNINLDDKPQKQEICRIIFNDLNNLKISLDKGKSQISIDRLEDIYKYKEQINNNLTFALSLADNNNDIPKIKES